MVLGPPARHCGVFAGLDLRYRKSKKLFNIGHRLQRDRLEHLDISFAWPFDNGLTLLGRSQQSLQDSRSLEQLIGFSYDSCCWAFRGGFRRTLNNDEEYENDYTVEMVFKGLGGLGNSVGNEFDRAILGYRDIDE